MDVFDFLDDDETKLQYLQEAEVVRNEYIEKNSIDPYPNFVEVVRKLSNRYKIAIVSNCGPGTIEHLISVLDINSSITDFCAASRFKISKAQAMERVKKDNNVMFDGIDLSGVISLEDKKFTAFKEKINKTPIKQFQTYSTVKGFILSES